MNKAKAIVLIKVEIDNVCDVEDVDKSETIDDVENMILDGDIDIYENMEIVNVKFEKGS